jgi:hypothetical protein
MTAEDLNFTADGVYSGEMLWSWGNSGLQDKFCNVSYDATCLFIALHQFKLYSLFFCVENGLLAGQVVFELREGTLEGK